MGIYRASIAGRRKPVLIKADGRNEAKDRIVTSLDLLTADDLEQALSDGESVWKAGEDLPEDEPEPEAEQQQD